MDQLGHNDRDPGWLIRRKVAIVDRFVPAVVIVIRQINPGLHDVAQGRTCPYEGIFEVFQGELGLSLEPVGQLARRAVPAELAGYPQLVADSHHFAPLALRADRFKKLLAYRYENSFCHQLPPSSVLFNGVPKTRAGSIASAESMS